MPNIILKHWWRHLLVLAAIIVLINFGLWQLRRLEQRRALNREIIAGLNQPAITLTGQDIDPEALHRRRVVATGQFENEDSLLLRGRSFQGQPGVELVVPLRLTNSNRAVLVNRGWIPLELSTPAARREFDVSGEITVEGIAYHTQERPNTWLAPTDPTPPPGNRLDEWFRVDIERIGQQVDYPLLPVFIEQSPGPAEAGTLPLREENIDLSEGPHLGYAVQWFSFAVILGVIYSAFTWQEWKKEAQL